MEDIKKMELEHIKLNVGGMYISSSFPPFPFPSSLYNRPFPIYIYDAGTIFEVAKSTLMKEKDSMLTLMFSGRYPLTQGNDCYPIYPSTSKHTSELTITADLLLLLLCGWFLYLGGDGAYFIDRDPTHFRLILN